MNIEVLIVCKLSKLPEVERKKCLMSHWDQSEEKTEIGNEILLSSIRKLLTWDNHVTIFFWVSAGIARDYLWLACKYPHPTQLHSQATLSRVTERLHATKRPLMQQYVTQRKSMKSGTLGPR